ncbi:phage-related protein-like protein [uncultured Mediterranean phage uvMED]|nr:phage-related protein-like protein [uncultured Mediterranean phage uvMED]
MADQKLRVDIIGDASKLNRALNTASGKLKSFGTRVSGVGKSLSTRLTLPLAIAGGMALKSAANFEKLKTQLNVLTGSADAGAKAFERLVKFSAGTPFQLDELVKANNTLMGFGVSAEDAFNHLQNIGDIAAVSGGDLQGISVAFGQVAAAGRLMGQDLLQLINNGVPIIDMLSNSMGVAKSEIKDMVSEGAVTFPVLIKAFKDATGEGGKFNGGMQTLSQTISGVFSTLKDNLNIAFAELGNEIFKAFDLKNVAQNFIKFIQNVTAKFKQLEPRTKKIGLALTGFAAILPPLLIVLGTLSTGIGVVSSSFSVAIPILIKVASAFKTLTVAMLANPVGIIATAVALLTAGMIELLHRLNPAVSRIQTFFNIIKSLGDPVKFATLQTESLTISLKEKSDAAAAAAKAQADLKKTLEGAVTPTKKLKTETDNLATSLDENLTPAAENVRDIMNKVLDTNQILADDFKNLATFDPNNVEVLGEDLIPDEMLTNLLKKKQVIQDALKDLNEGAVQILKAGISEIGVGLGEAIGAAISGTGNFVDMMGVMLLSTIGNVAKQLGTMAIQIGVGILAIQTGLKTLNPFVAIAAGVALVALGSIFSAGAKKIADNSSNSGNVPKFANGGIVSAPTLGIMGEYAGARSNPEVIAPLDKLKGMLGQQGGQNINVGGEFRIQGQDLVVALQRAEKNRSRLL